MNANAITVSTSDWDYPSALFSPLNQAGGYFSTSFESSSSAAYVSVTNAPAIAISINAECGVSAAWKLIAELTTVPSGLTIRVKRSNNGTGGILVGGTSYTVLSAVPKTLWCGWGDVSNISLQYQIDSLGVEDGYGLKVWNVRFTVETL